MPPSKKLSSGSSFDAIFQKESLGEYGSGWGWDSTYAHAFDNEAIAGVPTRYKSDGAGDDKDSSQNHCVGDIGYTDGQMLHSGSQMSNQISCNPSTGNGGNWYSWSTANAGGSKSDGNEPNSVCPKGWQLTINAATDYKSYYKLIRTIYNNQKTNDSDNLLGQPPLSFNRSGEYYQESPSARSSEGFYWSSSAYNSIHTYYLYFSVRYLRPQEFYDRNRGMSVRCVSR